MINKYEYKELVSSTAPKSRHLKTMISAFIVGGLICCFGELLNDLAKSLFPSFDEKTISGIVSITLIFIGALLTGLGVYDDIGNFAGGGSIVPITGFANSIVSPAMEFKKEGFVFGVAAKMFIIAGPVLVYGIGSSVIVGIIYYLFKVMWGEYLWLVKDAASKQLS